MLHIHHWGWGRLIYGSTYTRVYTVVLGVHCY